MSMVADDALLLSKTDLLALGRRVRDDGPSALEGDPAESSLLGAALVVATAKAHLVATVVRTGDIRRTDVWLSEVGVVACPNQDTDDVPGALVALPPVSALQVCTSVLGLDPSARAHPGSIAAPNGLGGLVEEVLSGGAAGEAVLNVFDWTFGDDVERWIVLDVAEGRVASLEAPADPTSELLMLSTSPLSLAESLASTVAVAVAPADDDDAAT